jgi:hypothetical protein
MPHDVKIDTGGSIELARDLNDDEQRIARLRAENEDLRAKLEHARTLYCNLHARFDAEQSRALKTSEQFTQVVTALETQAQIREENLARKTLALQQVFQMWDLAGHALDHADDPDVAEAILIAVAQHLLENNRAQLNPVQVEKLDRFLAVHVPMREVDREWRDQGSKWDYRRLSCGDCMKYFECQGEDADTFEQAACPGIWVSTDPSQFTPVPDATRALYIPRINPQACRVCKANLTQGALLCSDHPDGWNVPGYADSQWLGLRCPKCRHIYSLNKLGIPRSFVPSQEE